MIPDELFFSLKLLIKTKAFSLFIAVLFIILFIILHVNIISNIKQDYLGDNSKIFNLWDIYGTNNTKY